MHEYIKRPLDLYLVFLLFDDCCYQNHNQNENASEAKEVQAQDAAAGPGQARRGHA